MQSRLQNVAIKARGKTGAEQFVLKDSALNLAAAAEAVEQGGAGNARAGQICL